MTIVIPSRAPKARSRGITIIPGDGWPFVGTMAIPRLRRFAPSLGMTRYRRLTQPHLAFDPLGKPRKPWVGS